MVKTLIKGMVNKMGFELINKSKVPELVYSTDKDFQDLYELAQSKTQMTSTDNPLRRQRHYTLNHLLRNTRIADGDICELGCWRGLSAYQISSYIRSSGENGPFHIFDSFEGLSEYQSMDMPAAGEEDTAARRKQFACSLETVKENLKEFSFIKYYPGWIPDRFYAVEDRKFSFVHVDVDLYQPIRDSFLFFYPRMISKGIMVFDDYGYLQFPGAKKAVDECLKQFGNPFFVPLPSGQAFLIKDMH